MSDWQPGDLALCVNAARNPFSEHDQLRRGAIYTVTAVIHIWGDSPALILAEARHDPRDRGWESLRFRKICPHTPDAEDIETIRLLNGKPVRVEAA